MTGFETHPKLSLWIWMDYLPFEVIKSTSLVSKAKTESSNLRMHFFFRAFFGVQNYLPTKMASNYHFNLCSYIFVGVTECHIQTN